MRSRTLGILFLCLALAYLGWQVSRGVSQGTFPPNPPTPEPEIIYPHQPPAGIVWTESYTLDYEVRGPDVYAIVRQGDGVVEDKLQPTDFQFLPDDIRQQVEKARKNR